MTAWLERQGVAIRGLTGWRRFLLALLAGAASALAFAPANFFPALLLGFAILVLLLVGAEYAKESAVVLPESSTQHVQHALSLGIREAAIEYAVF